MAALKFVLLTDFSSLSKVAIHYALKMATRLDIEFTILHIVRVDGVPKSNLKWKQIEKTFMQVADEEGAKLLAELKPHTKATLNFKAIRAHTVADAVQKYCKKNYTNVVVMGSQGATQLKKFRMGGTTVSVIDSVFSPVLAIPQFAEFKNFKDVVYASDLKALHKELEQIIPFAKIFDSKIHLVHVVSAIDKKTEDLRLQAEAIIAKAGYSKIDFKLIIDDDIALAIDKYIKETKADLLTTFTPELSFYEKLFGLNVTRKLAYQGTIPLLSWKRK